MANHKPRPKTTVVQFRLDERDFKKLEKLAKMEFITISAYIRRCLLPEIYKSSFDEYNKFVNGINEVWDE